MGEKDIATEIGEFFKIRLQWPNMLLNLKSKIKRTISLKYILYLVHLKNTTKNKTPE